MNPQRDVHVHHQQGQAMTNFLQAGHRQLIDAECSALSGAWRRAAEARHDHDAPEPPEVERPKGRYRAHWAIACVAAVPIAGVVLLLTMYVLDISP